MQEIYIIYGIFASIFFASLLSLVKRSSVGFFSNVLFSSTSFLLSLLLLLYPDFQNSWLYVDLITKLMFVLITMIYLAAALHSAICIKNIKEFYLGTNYYWSLLAGFVLTMLLAVSTPSLGYAWLWLEASTIISAALILVERGKKHVESAWRYLLIASSGLAIGLMGIILYGSLSGSFSWVSAGVARGAFLIGSLLLIGFGTKAGIFPMHAWLPDAHGTAPSPVSALLSGALLPSSLIVYYRVFMALQSSKLFYLTLIVGILTVWVASLLMISQKKIKRLFAYSSMDVMGIATVGISLSYFNPHIIFPVLFLLLAHGMGKSALFLAAGTLKRHGLEDISDVHNLIKYSPALSFAILISALTVTGAPPFAMFFGEFGIFLTLIHYPVAFFFLILGVLISFLALNYHVVSMLFSEGESIKLKFSEYAVPLCVALASLIFSCLLYLYGWWLP